MLTIRLQRIGKKKLPTYRLIISEKGRDTHDKYLEQLGTFNPHVKENAALFNAERITYWMGMGASTSDTVHNMLVNLGIIKEKKKKAVFLSKKRTAKLGEKKKADDEAAKARAEKAAAKAVEDAAAKEAEKAALDEAKQAEAEAAAKEAEEAKKAEAAAVAAKAEAEVKAAAPAPMPAVATEAPVAEAPKDEVAPQP